ncbi:MAG: SpoIIE family protein phosphatase [Candidatus Sericytochromatia bacterium]|nr:SpoIIE family protein phosphatase [Candidatus Sericytochromatia bacterium]
MAAWDARDHQPASPTGPARGAAGARRAVLLALLAFATAWAWILVSAVGQVGTVYPGFRVNPVGTVWLTNEPHTPGVRAGLRPGDHVASADGVAVSSGPALRALVAGRAAGTPVAYEVRRDGRSQVVEVPATRLTWEAWLRSFAVRFVLPLVMALIGLAAAWLRPENPAARANAVFCLGWALYALLDIDFELTYRIHPGWYYAAVMAYASAALAMVLAFPTPIAWLQRHPQGAWTPYTVGLLLFLPIAGAFRAWGVTPEAVALGETLGTVWANGVLLFGLALLAWRWRRTTAGPERSQLAVLLWGIGAAFLPAAMLVNLPPLVGQPPAPPTVTALTTLLFGCFPAAVTYAVVRHGMFDIHVILKRTTTYAVVTFSLLGAYFALAGALRWVAALAGLGPTSDWQNAVVTAVIAVAFVPLRDAVGRLVDRHWFRTPYDFKAVVGQVTGLAQSTLDLDELKTHFLAVIGDALRPSFGYVLTRDPETGGLVARGGASVWGAVPLPTLEVHPEDPLLLAEARWAEVDYVPRTGGTGRLSSLARLGPHHRVPLQVGEEVVGLVVLGPRLSDQGYGADDRELLAATRLPLAAAVKTASLVQARLFKDRVEQDLRRAREVQEAMLPRDLPRLEAYDFAADTVPCYEASGDYYDVLPLPDGRVALAIADVAGKGIAAALATAMLKSCLHNQTRQNPEVGATIDALNRLLWAVSRHSTTKSYTTCAYALLTPATGHVSFACAGHFPPLHYSAAEGEVREVPSAGGFPLGVREATQYAVQSLTLRPGDALVFFTDGITEAHAPDAPAEMFESERLCELVAAHAALGAEDLVAAIKREVQAFVGDRPPSDDMTLLVLRATSG